jgi:hypothetical protein
VRYIGLSCLLVLLLCSVSAAEAVYGAKGGLSLATQEFDYSGQQELNVSRRTGLAGGLFVEWEVREPVSLVLEGMYVQRGVHVRDFVYGSGGPEPLEAASASQRVDYFSVAVLLKGELGFGDWIVYGAAGPRFDRMLGHVTSLGFEDLYRNLATWDIGSDMAIGVRRGQVLLEVRQGVSFVKSYDTELLGVTNSTLMVLAGLYF